MIIMEINIVATASSGSPSVLPISDDDILSLWYTVRPSGIQQDVMTYESGPYDVVFPTYELRRLVELAIEYAETHRGQLHV